MESFLPVSMPSAPSGLRSIVEARSRGPGVLAQFDLDPVAERAGREGAGEAMVEQDARIAPGGDAHLVGRQDEFVIHLLSGGGPGEMGMGLDQAGHQGLAGSVDDEVGGACLIVGAVIEDGGDALAFDEDAGRPERSAAAVEQADILDENSHFHSSARIGLAPPGPCFAPGKEKIK